MLIPNANEVIQKENTYNTPPDEGYQFVIARIELKNIGLVEKEFNAFELDAVGASSVVYRHGVKSEVIPDEFQSLRDISPGDTLVGNTFWEVKSSEVGSLDIYDDLVEPHIFFSLKPQ